MTDQASIRKFGAAMLALLLVAAQGCTSFNPVPPPKPGAYAAYRVGAPDMLEVTILPEPIIQRLVTVRPDGIVDLDSVALALLGPGVPGLRTALDLGASLSGARGADRFWLLRPGPWLPPVYTQPCCRDEARPTATSGHR